MIAAVKIGHRTYRVAIEPNGDLEDHGRQGEISHRKGEIRISDGLTPEGRAATLVHEILHGIFYDTGIDWTQEDEERMVERLTPRLCAFLVDNPDAVASLVGDLSGGAA